ncbi:hypothetical protein BGW80DRAFT_1455101 [Lactifluus volemus]|nr:hypothetical protein BGW80DRAFT_1455101 [Lactifluus volemus]
MLPPLPQSLPAPRPNPSPTHPHLLPPPLPPTQPHPPSLHPPNSRKSPSRGTLDESFDPSPLPNSASLRWSARTANFVYVFAGNVPFSKVTQFSRFLLDPFPSASLVPNHAWSRLIFNGVPCYDLDGTFYEDADLTAEIRKLPSLKTAHLTLAPRWLKPRDRILGNYSSATFAFSDPDHLITNTLFNSPLAMFGKAITVCKFVNRPPLTQCDRCWKLGHMANQPVCKLNQDTIRCYICVPPSSTTQRCWYLQLPA